MCGDITTAIRVAIKNTGMKQYAVAEQVGFTNKKFSDMLNGRYIPKACEIPNICRALDLTPNELFAFDSRTSA